MAELKNSYEDIIYMSHHVSLKHPHMSDHDRAAQFAPFAALTGHGAAIAETARRTVEKLELDESYAMVSDILEKINGVFEMEAKKKDIHYIHDVQIKHQHIMCDITKVQEILVNLISNAVKYTPHGGKVTVRLREIPSNKEEFMGIRTEIMDTGIGMSKDFLPLLFVAFARERNTTMGKIAVTLQCR